MDETQNEKFVEWLEKVALALEAVDSPVTNPGTADLYLHLHDPMVRAKPGSSVVAMLAVG